MTRDVRVLFIGGSGRSGTNVTRRVIGRHREVVTLPFEYRFLVDPDGIVDFYRSYEATWTPYLADRRLERLERLLRRVARRRPGARLVERALGRLDRRGRWLRPPAYSDWELDRHLPGFSGHVDALLEDLTSFTFPATWVGAEGPGRGRSIRHGPPRSRQQLSEILGRFVRRVLGDLLEREGGDLYAEDNTWNILLAAELLELVPGGKILHVYRDPRDVVASYVRQRWAPPEPEQAARWYVDILERWWQVRETLPAHVVLEISLEELVSRPRATCDRICDFAGLSFDESMLEESLDRAHSGRWMRELEPSEIEVVERLLAEPLHRLGYD